MPKLVWWLAMTGTAMEDTLPARDRYNRRLLWIAGLGGLLYGIDIGIIGSALPYLQSTSGLNANQLSIVVAAVLLGMTLSTLFAGWLADAIGRRTLMILAAVLFVISIPVIALAHGYAPLVGGRLLEGVSAGLVGVAVPLYLAESLPAAIRGKGTAAFQWLLTLGIVLAAAVGMYFSLRVAAVARLGDPARLLAFKNTAWRSIFWVSLPPGVVFLAGCFFLAESPRWLCLHGRRDRAAAALARSRPAPLAAAELDEIAAAQAAERARSRRADSLLQRKYLVPFLLACVILVLNQTTGVNSIIQYNAGILIQSGLSDLAAHWGYIIFTTVNFLATILGMVLVDKRGRKFLLTLGTAGAVIGLVWAGLLFWHNQQRAVNVTAAVQAMVTPRQSLRLAFTPSLARRLAPSLSGPSSLSVIYSYGGYQFAAPIARSDQAGAQPFAISRAGTLPGNSVLAFSAHPFGSLAAARRAPLRILQATLTPLPGAAWGWLTALSLFFFIACYALGPGIVVWLALSELMPTRIRSNGMSIALVLNEAVSTLIAAYFLPAVGRYGFATLFFLFAAATVVYFLVALFWLPETRGKTLEEIEAFFRPRPAPAQPSPLAPRTP
ncbi:MAG: MFS transporter [Terriglobales bacterium]